jgi:Cu2+-exporting ATPase
VQVDEVREFPGQGLDARCGATVVRRGRADWARLEPHAASTPSIYPSATMSKDGRLVAVFAFHERLRSGAREAVAALKERGLAVEMLSGDHASAVASLAGELGVARFEAGIRPGGKLARLKALAVAGRRTLMIGDGLNDAPALAAAHVSMAPSSAVDVGRSAADFVFMRDGLEAVPFALAIGRRARQLIRENFALAALYNAIALPFAAAGFVTPLVAALAMSASSLIVVANAMRLNRGPAPAGKRRTPDERRAGPPSHGVAMRAVR